MIAVMKNTFLKAYKDRRITTTAATVIGFCHLVNDDLNLFTEVVEDDLVHPKVTSDF